MVTEIQIRQDTTENWVTTNPILADGEIGYDTTVMRFKVGNGVYKWTELSYTKNEMYDDTLVNEKINQINEDLSQKSNSSDVYTKQQIEDMLYITEDELYAKNYMEKNEALDKFITRQEVWEQNYEYVPTERTINGKELSEDIVLDYTDVQALPDTTYIPQKMSDLENDEGYLTSIPSEYVTETELDSKGYLTQHQDISGKADKETTYTKEEVDSLVANVEVDAYTKTEVNALLNNKQDAGSYATKEELEAKQDKGDYALIENIPTLVSQLDNDSGYTTQLDVMQAIASIPQFKLQIVDSLSRDNGEPMVLYLVSKGGSAPDVYDEYIWLEETGNYEFLGTTAVDLTGYVKNTDYATTSKGGVIKAYTQNGFGINNSGQPFSQTINLASYKNYGGNYFVGKGTLENIKYDLVKEGVVNNNISLGESDKQKVRNWIGASAEVIQKDSFSSWPADRNPDKIFQYIGETTEEYVNGYFYRSVAGESNYVTSEPRDLTFNYDLFWSELENAGITLETLRLTEEVKVRGGFSIMGLSESETEYRVTNINGIDINVLLTKSVQSSQNIVGTSTRWYYTYTTIYEWESIEVQPEQDLTDYVKNTDYATEAKAGVIKVHTNYATGIYTDGNLRCESKTLAQYRERGNAMFMSKGTLENIKNDFVKRAITENDIELTDDEKTSAKQWLGYATQSDINTAIANLPQFKISILDTLPETGETKVLYLVPKDSEAPDVYNEYIWIEDTSSFEFLGSTAVDLTDYVKNTDYAQGAVGGVVKTSAYYGVSTNAQGFLLASQKSLSDYDKGDNAMFVAKGTLTNVLTQYAKTVSLTQADYDALATKDSNTLYLIEEE